MTTHLSALEVVGGLTTASATVSGALTAGSFTPAATRVTDATYTATAADHLRTIVLARAAGVTVTLPAATGSGLILQFVVGVTVTSNNDIINTSALAQAMHGLAHTADDTGTPVPGVWVATGSNRITLNGSTKGGIIGDQIVLTDIGTALWSVRANIKQSGTEATPFSTEA
jgi:hypothetical protein